MIAAWSPAATPRRVWPSISRAFFAAIEMSAISAAARPGADRRAVDRRDDDLRAVDHVVDEVARLAPDARAHREVARHLLDHRHVAAGREALAGAAQDRDARLADRGRRRARCAPSRRARARWRPRACPPRPSRSRGCRARAGESSGPGRRSSPSGHSTIRLRMAVTYDDVAAAHERIKPQAQRTPVLTSRHGRRAHRREGVLQVREPPAHGRVQVPRRLQRAVAARGRAREARRDRVLLGQPRAGGGARRASCSASRP